MAETDPTKPQANDPELEAELIRVLSIVGPLGKLDIIPAILPIISMGNVVQQTVEVRSPSYRSTDIFSIGVQVASPAATVHADTGPLAEGVFDLILLLTQSESALNNDYRVQHRNAANAANLMEFGVIAGSADGPQSMNRVEFAYEFAASERLRIINSSVFGAGVRSSCTIFARRRT